MNNELKSFLNAIFSDLSPEQRVAAADGRLHILRMLQSRFFSEVVAGGEKEDLPLIHVIQFLFKNWVDEPPLDKRTPMEKFAGVLDAAKALEPGKKREFSLEVPPTEADLEWLANQAREAGLTVYVQRSHTVAENPRLIGPGHVEVPEVREVPWTLHFYKNVWEERVVYGEEEGEE